jgi:hypothetical protein
LRSSTAIGMSRIVQRVMPSRTMREVSRVNQRAPMSHEACGSAVTSQPPSDGDGKALSMVWHVTMRSEL